jgi:hypothetical protein
MELQDYELQKTATEPPSAPTSTTHPIGRWAMVALAVAAAAAAIYLAFMRRPLPAAVPGSTAQEIAPTSSEPRSLGGRSDQIDVPPLNDSDPLVRTLIRALSKSPGLEAWLATNGLIRNFVVVVSNVADGTSPVKQLKLLRPSSAFRVVARDGRQYIDPKTFDRYAVFADAVVSVDAAGAARLYATLKPRIGEAYGELGVSDPVFDHTLERAIIVLLRTPVVNDSIRVRPKGIGYGFADERLEGLTAAQQQLLRMGPRNVQRIQEKLREIAGALGIPPGELPAK